MVWVLALILLLATGLLGYAIASSGRGIREKEERRRRYVVEDVDERIPLAEAGVVAGSLSAIPSYSDLPPPLPASTQTAALPTPPDGDSLGEYLAAAPPATVTGRIVETPDGEMILTTPPFTLRASLFTPRQGRWMNLLARKLPAWLAVCPRVRLDTLVTPAPPDLRDPEDWRTWRRRVRTRSIDALICDRRQWRPVVAIMIDAPLGPVAGMTAMKIAGGRDRMIDELLLHVGLPVLHVSGNFHTDWPIVRPYVDQSILRSHDPLIEGDGSDTRADEPLRPTPKDAVNLIRMDRDGGWLLE